jgi:nucleotide-binding universal stress UspA family protein
MRSTSRKIVVGFDGSDLADLALQWAVDTAALRHDPVEVLVAAALPSSLAAWTPGDNSYRDAMKQVAEQAEKRLADLGHHAVPVHLVDGDAVPELVHAGEDAELLVVGATGHSRLAAGLMGSVSRHLATYAPGSVAVVRPQASPDARRIVVGVETGPSSVPALRFALERASLMGAPLTVVHAFDADLPHGGELALPSRMRVDTADAERTVAEALSGVEEDFPDVEVTRETVPLRPDRVLVDASESASLVVVGARGRNAFARLLLGSVSQHVLQHAHCPVAVIR